MTENKGIKHDQKKPKLDLIPTEALLALGNVLSFGAEKYKRANWANGIEYSRLISAALRHLMAFNAGEDIDPESGLPHVDHALCNLAFLSWMRIHRADMDDRWMKVLTDEKRVKEAVARLQDISKEATKLKGTGT